MKSRHLICVLQYTLLKHLFSSFVSIKKCYSISLLRGTSFNVEGSGTPLQYSCLENPMGREAWWAAVHGVAKSQRWLSDFTSLFTFMHWRRKWQPTPVSCLENPRDWGAWWAAVYGVAQSRTRLKWLSSRTSILSAHTHFRQLNFIRRI